MSAGRRGEAGTAALITLAALLVPVPVLSADGTWEVLGSHTLRADYYLLRGPRAGSPYRFGGWQPYGELSLQAEGRPEPFRRWRLQMLGTLNGSDYRSPRQGAVPERLAVLLEDGDVAVPYRVEAGDLYGYFSYRTLQRSLKGLALELQPRGRRQSLLLLVGSGARGWRGLRPLDDLTAGLSYLLEAPSLGRWAVSLVEHHGEAPVAGEGSLRQRVLSVAGAGHWGLLGQRLGLEGELGWFRGDHAGTGAGVLRDRTDRALFLELTGQDGGALDHRLRLERYGPDYRPAGVRVPGGRLAQALGAGWRTAGGGSLRLRLERQRQDWRGANPVDVKVGALRASGPLTGAGHGTELQGMAELLGERIRDAGRTRDTRARVLRAGLTRAWSPALRGRVELYVRNLDDRVGAQGARIRQVQVGLRRGGRWGRWRGAVEPGLVLRRLRGAVAGWEWEPTLWGRVASGPHRVALALGYLDQERSGTSVDVATYRLRVDYRFRRGGRAGRGAAQDPAGSQSGSLQRQQPAGPLLAAGLRPAIIDPGGLACRPRPPGWHPARPRSGHAGGGGAAPPSGSRLRRGNASGAELGLRG